MNEYLCDRCFSCAQQVLETYDNEEELKSGDIIIEYISFLISILDEYNNVNYPSKKVENLSLIEYTFLNDKCIDCSINNNDLLKNKKSF